MTSAAIAATTGMGLALSAIFGAIWRLGTKVGGMTQELHDHNQRLDRLEKHQDDHDAWHLGRGDR